MKMTYIFIGIILAIGIFFFLTSCGSKSKHNKQIQTNKDSTSLNEHHAKINTFNDLREMAFSITPEQLQLSLPTDETVVYGVIMDWGMGGATATITSYLTGDASLYLSSGGGVIGGGQHQNVNAVAKQFVNLGQTYLKKATKVVTTDLPTTDQVKFYLLTNKGNFAGQDILKNIENNSSEWLRLFEEGKKVLTELRMTTEKE